MPRNACRPEQSCDGARAWLVELWSVSMRAHNRVCICFASSTNELHFVVVGRSAFIVLACPSKPGDSCALQFLDALLLGVSLAGRLVSVSPSSLRFFSQRVSHLFPSPQWLISVRCQRLQQSTTSARGFYEDDDGDGGMTTMMD